LKFCSFFFLVCRFITDDVCDDDDDAAADNDDDLIATGTHT